MRRRPGEVACSRGGAGGTTPRRGEAIICLHPQTTKGTIVKHISRLPVLAGGIVLAAFLLAPATNSRVDAQVTVYRYQQGGYYNPYGQGPYTGYGRNYTASGRANTRMFPGHGGTFTTRTYGYSVNGNVPTGYGKRIHHRNGPPVRVYGGSSYYQPSYGPVYVPFGYPDY